MSSNKRLTNEEVDLRLLSDKTPTKRIGNYVNAHTKIDWKCTTCGHIWATIPNNILKSNPSGCPACFGNVKYTNADIDYKIKHRKLSRVSNYINYDTNITWKCVQCSHVWDATPNNVIGKNSNCPVCSRIQSGKNKSFGQKDRVLKILTDNNINIIGKYTKVTDRHDFKCMLCDHEWSTHINNIVNSGSGCPSCVGLVKLTNEDVDERLLFRDDTIRRIDNIVNMRTKCTWQCTNEHVWQALPDSVLNLGTGCPYCNKKGLYDELYVNTNPNDIETFANLYLVKIISKSSNEVFIKIGITKRTIPQRFSSYKRNYNIETLFIKQQKLFDCIRLEQNIITRMRRHQYIPEGKFIGRTECFVDIPEVKEAILKLLE